MRTLLGILGTLSIACLAAFPAGAGTVSLTWDPVSDTDLAGYRVYYGTSPGSYPQSLDVGNVIQATVPSLTDCTTWYFAVKAYDAAGNLSASYSNEVSGWPRPAVTASSPAAAEQGRTLDLVVTGTNFMTGASVQFGNAGIVVNSVTVTSCTQLTANVTVGASAATGATNVDVTNADHVYGSGAGLFTVQAAAPPTVRSTSPADGATGVSATVHPTVAFSEAMLPSSITASTVKLLNDTGAAVAQAAGSPSLSADGITATITPASSLVMGKTYKIQVVGGASGVKDLANNAMATTYTHATGFSTTPDTTAPVISAVQSGNVGRSTADITWTTDELSDSQVFYRETGQTAYQQTDVNSSLVTTHSVSLTGLEPATTYEYHVRSADGAGNATTSTPDKTFTTGSSTYAYLRFEAETGTLVSPVRTTTGSASFGGAWIDTPAGTSTGTPASPAGTATFGVNVPTAGTWYLWVRLYGADASSDSWFESVDSAARQAIVASRTGAWTWVAGRSYTLTQGLHAVELGGMEAKARADRVLLTNDPSFVPSEQPVDDQTAPSTPTNSAGAPSDKQITLTWTNPSNADFRKTVIRYRNDGRYPVSTADGFAVTEKSGTAGANDSYVHTGLVNGTTYAYSIFSVDASGNASTPSHVQATPIDNVAPATVRNARRTDVR